MSTLLSPLNPGGACKSPKETVRLKAKPLSPKESPVSLGGPPLDPDGFETLQKDLMKLEEPAVLNLVQNSAAKHAQTSPTAIGALKDDLASMQSAILDALEDQKKHAGKSAEAIVTLQGELAHMRAAMLTLDEQKRDEGRLVEDALQGSPSFATLQNRLASMCSLVLKVLEHLQKSSSAIMPPEGDSSMQSSGSPKALANMQSEMLEANTHDAGKNAEAIASLQKELANMRTAMLSLDEHRRDAGRFVEDALRSSASFAMLQSSLTSMCSEVIEKLEPLSLNAILEALEDQKRDADKSAEAITILHQELVSMRSSVLAVDELKRIECIRDGLQNSSTAAMLQSDLASMRSEVLEALENLQKSSKIIALEDNSSILPAMPEAIEESRSLQGALDLDLQQSPKSLVKLQSDLSTMDSEILEALERQPGVQDAIIQTMQKIPEAIEALETNFTKMVSAKLEALGERRSLQSSTVEDTRQGPTSLDALQNDLAQIQSQVLEAIDSESQKRLQGEWDVEPTLAEWEDTRTKVAVFESFENLKKLILTISRSMDEQTQALQKTPEALAELGEKLPGFHEMDEQTQALLEPPGALVELGEHFPGFHEVLQQTALQSTIEPTDLKDIPSTQLVQL